MGLWKDFPYVDEFCCGWSLKTGTIFAGGFTLGKVLFLFSVWSLGVSLLSVSEKDFYQKNEQIEDEESYMKVAVPLAMCLPFVMVSLFLINGATKAKTDDHDLIPWIFWTIIEVLATFSVIYDNFGVIQFGWVWFFTLCSVFQIYLVVVVLSFMKQIQASDKH